MKSLFIVGIIFFLGAFILVIKNYPDLDVERNGEVVEMKIEHLPQSCPGARVRYFVTYSYNGEIYEKATRGNFCEVHTKGEQIRMKYLEGSKNILFPGESVTKNLVSFIILGLFGLGLSLSQWFKMKK